jgi:hypothetical protein
MVVHLTSMYPTVVHLIDVYLTRHASRRRVSHGRAPHGQCKEQYVTLVTML